MLLLADPGPYFQFMSQSNVPHIHPQVHPSFLKPFNAWHAVVHGGPRESDTTERLKKEQQPYIYPYVSVKYFKISILRMKH